MICPSCLRDNDDSARVCAHCGAEIASSILTDLAAGDASSQPPGTLQTPEVSPVGPLPLSMPPPIAPAPPFADQAQAEQGIADLLGERAAQKLEQTEAEQAIANLLARRVDQMSSQEQAPPEPPPAPPVPPAVLQPQPRLSNEFPLPPPPPGTKTKEVSCRTRGCCGCVALVVGVFVALMIIGFYAEKSDQKKGANPATGAILAGTFGGVHVSDVQLSKHIGKNDEPVELTDELTSPTDTEFYVHFHWTGASSNTVFVGQLFCAGVKDDDYDTELPVKNAEGNGFFHFTWKGGFNPGQYMAKILLDNQVICQIPLTVTGQHEPSASNAKTGAKDNASPPTAIDPWAGATFARVALNEKWGKALPADEDGFSAVVGPAEDQGEFQVRVGLESNMLAVTRVMQRKGGGTTVFPDAYAAAKPAEPNKPGRERAIYVASHIPGFSLDPAFIQVTGNDPNWTRVSLDYESATTRGSILVKWTGDSKYEVQQAYSTQFKASGGEWLPIPSSLRVLVPGPGEGPDGAQSVRLLARWANVVIVRAAPQTSGAGESYVLGAFDPTKGTWEKLASSQTS